MKRNQLKSKRGATLILVTALVAALAVYVFSFAGSALTERKLNMRHEVMFKSQNAAEAIVEYGFAQLRHKFENRTNFAVDAMAPGSGDELAAPPSSFFGSEVDYGSVSIMGGTIPPFPAGLTYIDPADPDNEFDPLKGKMVKAREIAIYGTAGVSDPRLGDVVSTYVAQRLQVRDAPLFAHAIFYNLDLEFHPGPAMDVYGPVHTNGNLYVQAIDSLRFHNQVTTAGHMLRGWPHQEAEQNGDVSFKDRYGNFKSMKISGTYYDSTMGGNAIDNDFHSFSANRWHGNMATSMHGIEEYVPVAFDQYAPDDPSTAAYDPINAGRAIIEPALPTSHADYDAEIESQKISTLAGLRFDWDATTSTVRAYKRDGTELDITPLIGGGSNKLVKHTGNAFLDRRRGADISIVDINVGKLKQLIEDPDNSDPNLHIDNFDPDTEWNGIVYFGVRSTDTNATNRQRLNHTGVRLWGGDTDASGQGIPNRGADEGMTFATNNVLYIRGDFNADGNLHQAGHSEHSALVPEDGEVPVAVMGDAVTFLSDNWVDKNSSQSPPTKPNAQDTEVAVAIVSGLVPSNSQNNNTSSGGAHNFPRFLESWSNDDFFIRGSMVSLYETEVDRSLYSTAYYSPPRRKWGFSNLFRDGTYPPGTPLLRTYRRIDYTALSKSEYEAAIAALPWNADED